MIQNELVDCKPTIAFSLVHHVVIIVMVSIDMNSDRIVSILSIIY